jgi:hypothetical protein
MAVTQAVEHAGAEMSIVSTMKFSELQASKYQQYENGALSS